MSAIATAWAWDQHGVEPLERLVLLALAEGTNHQGQCWPVRATLQGMCGVSETKIIDALQRLVLLGLIYKEEHAGQPTRVFLQLQNRPAPKERTTRELVPVDISADMGTKMEHALAAWNEMAKRTASGNKEHRLAQVRKLTDDMRRRLKQRLSEAGLAGWEAAVFAVELNAHCRGVNDRKWQADFHYLLQAKGFSKALNGGWPPNYEEMTNAGQRTGPVGRGDQRLDGIRGFDAAIRGRASPKPDVEGGGEGSGVDASAAGGGEGQTQPRLPPGGAD